MLKIKRIDHIVLTVKNIDIAVSFYQKVLGMKKIVFGEGRVALSCGDQKINLHELGNEFEPKAENVKDGSADLCFIIEQSLDNAIEHLKVCNVPVIEGPIERTGSKGRILSAYFRDLDGNLIEISNYL